MKRKRRKSKNHCGLSHRKYSRKKYRRNRNPETPRYAGKIEGMTVYADAHGHYYVVRRGKMVRSPYVEDIVKRGWSDKRKDSKAQNPRKILKTRRQLSVPERHQLKIAMDTLRMPDAMANVMGGPTKAEAREIIFRFTGRTVKENPAKRRTKKTKAKTYYVVTDNEGAWLTETPSKKDAIVFGPTTNLFEAERALSREAGSGD